MRQYLIRAERENFRKKILSKTKTTELQDFDKEIKQQTYKDILDSTYMRKQFAIKDIDMNGLKAVGSNKMRVLALGKSENVGDLIDIVLGLAILNLEIYLASISDCDDLSTDRHVKMFIVAKAKRYIGNENVTEGFSKILEINDIPSISQAIISQEISLQEICKIRENIRCKEFRQWFHKNIKDNPSEATKRYVSAISEGLQTNKLPLKAIRFVITTTGGLIPGIGPFLGAVSSAIDSFLFEKLIQGPSPKFFIDDIRHCLFEKPHSSH